MKIKTLILGALLLVAPLIQAQFYTYYPTNTRYIGGGYTNKAPFFKTLNTALNDVKPYATSDNPYTFWLMSDTSFIADWDSIYNQGMNMSDSIYTYYVRTGKIKWAGFDIDTTKGGRGGSPSTSISSMNGSTTHYSLVKWTNSGLPLATWQIQLSEDINDIDSILYARTLFGKIDPKYFTIHGDTLYITLPSHMFVADDFYTDDFDSTTYVRTFGNQSIYNTKTIYGTLGFYAGGGPVAAGKLLLPSASQTTPRAIWADGNYLYYYAGAKVITIAAKDSAAGTLLDAYIISWNNLTTAVRDSIHASWLKNTYRIPADSSGLTKGSLFYKPADGIVRRKY